MHNHDDLHDYDAYYAMDNYTDEELQEHRESQFKLESGTVKLPSIFSIKIQISQVENIETFEFEEWTSVIITMNNGNTIRHITSNPHDLIDKILDFRESYIERWRKDDKMDALFRFRGGAVDVSSIISVGVKTFEVDNIETLKVENMSCVIIYMKYGGVMFDNLTLNQATQLKDDILDYREAYNESWKEHRKKQMQEFREKLGLE